MGSDRSELKSSIPPTLQDNTPSVNFQGSGSLLPLQPLETSAGDPQTEASIHESNGHVSQQAAAAILRDFDDAKIFNSLSVLRALSPGYQQSSHPEALSMQQLTALSVLKDYQNEDIVACLEACRRGSFQASPGSAGYGLHPATATCSSDFWAGSSASMKGLSVTISSPPSFYDSGNAGENTPRSSLSHANSFVDLSRENSHSEGVAPASGTSHQHWCTVCERPPMTTCDGWKRHEKEKHEKGYMCMPNGPVEANGSSLQCAFCGLLNPSHGHLEGHDAGLCAHKLDKDRRYTRKLGLINHLKTHGILEASDLADRWKVWLRKRFYACGFCIQIFSSNADRLNHIDSQHYRYSQNIDEWDANIVIRGLLLQPDVLASWQDICPWNPDPRHADLTWDPHAIAALQSRLEMSEEPAHQLATDALYQSRIKPSQGIQTMSLPFESVSRRQTGGGARLAVDLQQYTLAPFPSSLPPSKSQEKDAASLQFQAHNLSGDVAQSNTMDPVLMHVDPPQNLDVYPGLEIDDGYRSDATTHSPWHRGEVTSQPITNQPSQSLSGIGAAAVPNYGNALGQSGPTALEPWQSKSSRYTNGCDSSEIPHYSVHCVAGTEDSRTSIRPGSLPLTSNRSNPSFSTVTIATGPAKSPSIVGQMKRRLSRMKMGIDVDDVMLHMQDDDRSRSEWRADRCSK